MFCSSQPIPSVPFSQRDYTLLCQQPAFIELRVIAFDRLLSQKADLIAHLISQIEVPEGCDLWAAIGGPDWIPIDATVVD